MGLHRLSWMSGERGSQIGTSPHQQAPGEWTAVSVSIFCPSWHNKVENWALGCSRCCFKAWTNQVYQTTFNIILKISLIIGMPPVSFWMFSRRCLAPTLKIPSTKGHMVTQHCLLWHWFMVPCSNRVAGTQVKLIILCFLFLTFASLPQVLCSVAVSISE